MPNRQQSIRTLHRQYLPSVQRLKLISRSSLVLGLVVLLTTGFMPPAVASSVIGEAAVHSRGALDLLNQKWMRWFGEKPVSPNFEGRGVKPAQAESRSQKEARVADLKTNTSGPIVLQPEQPLVLVAMPVDADDTPIHALLADWESSNQSVVSVKKNGQAIARRLGVATLTARAGSLSKTIQVHVVKGNGEKFGGKKKQDSIRDAQSGEVIAAQNAKPALIARNLRQSKRHHTANGRRRNYEAFKTPVYAPPLQNYNVDPLPDAETSSLYQPSNSVGAPLGKLRAAATTLSAAVDGTETNGTKNFTFSLPIVSLPGRSLNASLSLVYNSAVWHKSVNSSSATWMTYDVDSGWPATGWRLSLGQLEDQGSNGFTLVEANGTRHSLVNTGTNNYDTIDGTFIHYTGASGWGTLYYPDGTQVQYGQSGGGYRSYPNTLIDRNGNYVFIYYVNDVGPKISTIIDSMGRYIRFYYASNGDLVTITAPGLGGSSDRQVMRFYYTDVTLGSSLFGSGINVSGPSSVHNLQYVYLPGSSDGSNPHTGYKFTYSPYGMIREITKSRGMTVNSTSTSSAGSVTSDGTMATQTTYGYATSGQSYTDVPTYSTRTDEWAGRTTGGSAPVYNFSVNESTGVSTVTAPDGTINEINAIVNAGQWNDGLVSDTYVKDSSTTYFREHLDWQLDSNNKNPRIYQILRTDVPASLTTATVLTFTTYNNISVRSERDFGSSPTTPSSTELRRTETTYVTSSNYTNRYLRRLPSIVKVFPGGSSSAASRVDYAYDDYGTSHANLTARNDIIMHSPAFDPFQETQVSCDMVCNQYDHWGIDCIDWREVCNYYNPYEAATDYRGNVTSITRYSDAATPSGSITHSMTYDIAGNVMTAQVDCCQQKSFTYSGGGSGEPHDYAYVISITSGNPSGTHVTASATYDYNTGLVATTTDENTQTTTNYYNTDSLRLEHIAYPGSGATYFTYSDGFTADANSVNHFYVESAVKLDNNGSGGATRYRYSRQYFDGRGEPARTMSNQTSTDGWSTQDIEYDSVGRAYRTSNPYFASAYGSTPLSSTNMFWTTATFDRLDRVTQLDMPRGDNNNSNLTHVYSSFDGAYTTITDQAGKVRRQKVDALGHIVRLDEPTTSGLGTVGSPNQATYYYYNALDNIVRINQDAQNRYFMYDSLARLIRERQTEQTPNSSYNLSDSVTGNGSWTRKVDYNSSGLVTDTYDARGVHAQFAYDGLNRVATITYSDSTPTAHYYYDSASGLPSGAPSSSSPDSYSAGYSTGRLVATTYGSGAQGTYFGYDVMGRAVQQFQLTGSGPAKYKLTYAYNYAGMLTNETYPTTRSIDYVYDEGGRLSQVKNGSTIFASSFQFEPDGALKSETWGNTAIHTQSYNRRLQASQAKVTLGSTVLQQYDYGYGTFNSSTGAVDASLNNGQIGSITGSINGTTQWLQGFQYDELGRLSNVAEYQGASMSSQTYSQGYTYDRYGNKRQSSNSTLTLPSISTSDYDTTNNNNRFVSSVASYDNAGNITTDSKFRGYSFSYDAYGRVTSATGSWFSQNSTYDCEGRRVQTAATVGGVSYRTMVYDIFGQLVVDYNGSGGTIVESENVYRGGQLLARYDAPQSAWKYLLSDAQGTTRTVMNNNGSSSSVVARHDYLPFGEEIGSGIGLRSSGQGYGGSDLNRLRYAQTERDDVTAQDHTWFRKYESLSGRFTSPDPLSGTIRNPQSLNHYSYSINDPVNLMDPTGLMCIQFHFTNVNNPSDNFWTPWFCTPGWSRLEPRGGSGGRTAGPSAPDPPKTPYVDTDVLNGCTEDLFGVTTDQSAFKESTLGSAGSFKGTGPDVINKSGNNNTFTITNDTSKYSLNVLKQIHETLSGTKMGKNERVTGTALPDHPWINYTANNLTPQLEVLKTQIHELGHSLDVITGVRYKDKGIEAGFKLENCVRDRGGFKFR